ncbi:hypothetical protein LY78DRAFT_657773 [Colletotrichum sublineola]|nr:hypothetical protein LY78DRAFT_657773 [Colletotrichum sublineola]
MAMKPHPFPFTSKDPRMQDPKGEHPSGGDNDLNHFSNAIIMCPVYVATEPAYALARQIKKMRKKRADRKAAEEGKYSNKKKWDGRK